MSSATDKTPSTAAFYLLVNPLLCCLLAFSTALLVYVCTHFFTYLPTADTWAHIDLLTGAAEGKLDSSLLFTRHNDLHLLALPKLIYFLDVWLGSGTGAITTAISLLFMLSSAALACYCIGQLTSKRQEKTFLYLVTCLLLTSPIQVESLLNPANVQWSLLNFFAVLSAFSLQQYLLLRKTGFLVLLFVGCAGVALSSASALLILIPITLVALSARYPGKVFTFKNTIMVFLLGSGFFIVELLRAWLLPETPSLYLSFLAATSVLDAQSPEFQQAKDLLNNSPIESLAYLLYSLINFVSDFFAPPFERIAGSDLSFTFLLLLTLLGLSLLRSSAKKENENKTPLFFLQLVLTFCIVIAFSIGLVRSFHPSAYTFRFANLGLLFAAAAFPLLLFACQHSTRLTHLSRAIILSYLAALTWVNSTESLSFGHGRNHMRLTQVAYSVDVRDSFVIAAMPGTSMEKPAYEFIQANKHKLANKQIGVYASEAVQNIGKPINSLQLTKLEYCDNEIKKMRRLTAEQASYKVTGSSHHPKQGNLTHMYFTDGQGIIRGYGINVVAGESLWAHLLEEQHWAGFVNLENADSDLSDQVVFLNAYDSSTICPAHKIMLPAYREHKKQNKNKKN